MTQANELSDVNFLKKSIIALLIKLKNNDLKVLSNKEIRNSLNNQKLSDTECETISNKLKIISLLTAKIISNAE